MRLTLVLALLAIIVPGSLWAQTSEARQETCRVTSGIVSNAVSMRIQGSQPDQAKRVMTEGDLKVGERYVLAVAPLVDWVFTIDDAIIDGPDAPQRVSGEFLRECLAFPE